MLNTREFFDDILRRSPVLYHLDTYNEGFFSERQLRNRGLFLSPSAHVVHYAGTGFEGERFVFDPKTQTYYAIGLDDNISRLFRTMDHLLITRPQDGRSWYLDFRDRNPQILEQLKQEGNPLNPRTDAVFLYVTPEQVIEAHRQLFRRNYQGGHLRIKDPKKEFVYGRPAAYRGDFRDAKGRSVARLGVYPLSHVPVLQISLHVVGNYLANDVKLVVSPEGNISSHLGVKLGANYVPLGRGKGLAMYNGYDEVLVTSPRGEMASRLLMPLAGQPLEEKINEGGGENFFGITPEGILITPPVESGRLLPGTKRGYIIELAKNLGIRVEEREIPLSELNGLEAIALSGTWAGLQPVRFISDPVTGWYKLYQSRENKILAMLMREYDALVFGGDMQAEKNMELRDRIRKPILVVSQDKF